MHFTRKGTESKGKAYNGIDVSTCHLNILSHKKGCGQTDYNNSKN